MFSFFADYLHEIEEPLRPDAPIRFLETFVVSAMNSQYTEHLKLRVREIIDDVCEAYEPVETYQDFETKLAQSLVERRDGKRLV